MSRNTKIILGIVGGLMVICMCGAGVVFATGLYATNKVVDFAAQNVTSDPQKIASLAERIATFEAPAEFHGDYGMDLMGITLVGYTGSDAHSHIMFIQFPSSMNLTAEEMEQQLKQATQNQNYTYGNQEMKVIESREVTIKGQKATANISEGSGSGGDFRQLSVAFNGNGGPALLVYNTPVASWDDAAAEALLASVQ